ncbi:helix-turn-helix domain-containing protein [Cytobacillus firmus]|nr:helix-turn-helix domain-containing protein [Cytobacillus firmus]
MDKPRKVTNDRKILKSVGKELRDYRNDRNYTLRDASDKIGISENYLSEIERGLKNPNDDIIRNMAVLYGLDEKYLFDRFERVPLVVTEELKDNDRLGRTMYNIVTDDELSDADKEELYRTIENLYKQHFKK